MRIPTTSTRALSRDIGATFRQGGFSLVELMVAVAVSLIMVAVASSVYLSSRTTYKAVDELAQLQEQGRMALSMIGRDIRQSGYTQAVRADNTQYLRAPLTTTPILACDDISSPPNDLVTCTAGTAANANGFRPDGLSITYESEPLNANFQTVAANTAAARGTNCLGNAAPYYSYPLLGGAPTLVASPTYPVSTFVLPVVLNYYYVATKTQVVDGVTQTVGTLRCASFKSDGTLDAGQQLFQGVEDLQVTFGIGNSDSDNTVRQFVTVTAMNATPVNWTYVTAVRVCVLMRTQSNNVSLTRQPYTDCSGTVVTPSGNNRWLWRAFTETFATRNHVGGWAVPYSGT